MLEILKLVVVSELSYLNRVKASEDIICCQPCSSSTFAVDEREKKKKAGPRLAIMMLILQ